MTAEQFTRFWQSTYPDTVPISHFLKHDYHERWFRIHSLPLSKRYADTPEEWNILLSRQNEIFTDILGDNYRVILVTGDYNFKKPKAKHVTKSEPAFKDYSFTRIGDIDLHILSDMQYTDGQVYRPAIADTIWEPGRHDVLLREIANDGIEAFFISEINDAIVAPYDGGVDFVLKDAVTRDLYKEKYKDWLSAREDGL